MRLATAIIAAACLISAAAEAQTAATFSYVDAAANIDLTGQIMGSLAGNYFTIASVGDLTFNGRPVAFTPTYDGSLDAANGYGGGHNGDGSAVVTLDGSYMDWLAAIPGDGFSFGDGDQYAQLFGSNYGGGISFGRIQVAYDPADWTLDVSVPEPAGLTVFGVGCAVLGFVRKRRVGLARRG